MLIRATLIIQSLGIYTIICITITCFLSPADYLLGHLSTYAIKVVLQLQAVLILSLIWSAICITTIVIICPPMLSSRTAFHRNQTVNYLAKASGWLYNELVTHIRLPFVPKLHTYFFRYCLTEQ